MNDGMFVFDDVIHMFDLREDNLLDTPHAKRFFRGFGKMFGGQAQEGNGQGAWAQLAQSMTVTDTQPPQGGAPTGARMGMNVSVEDAHRFVFEESDTDMVVAGVVPWFSYFRKGISPVENCAAFAKAYPDRVLLAGGVDPVWQGLDVALSEMERQVKELGAKTIKFYNWQDDKGWRCDDPKLAYPLYERAGELGLKHVEFHKGYPIGLENMEGMHPGDIQAAARDFPDMIFLVHHMGAPWFEEMSFMGQRFDNIWTNFGGVLFFSVTAPHHFGHMLGRMLQQIGPERIVYGSEGVASGSVQPSVELFANYQIPEELQENYGYPPITPEIRKMIFGENCARLFGIDIEQKLREFGKVAAR